MFERFTDSARRVVALAQEESRLLRHDRIGTEHLLLALLREDNGSEQTVRALHAAGVTLDEARTCIMETRRPGEKEPSGHIPFTARAKKVLELSLRASLQVGANAITATHLLSGTLDVPDGTAVATLQSLGVDVERLAGVAAELAREEVTTVEAHGPAVRRPVVAPRPGQGGRRGRDPLVARFEDVIVQREALAVALRRYARHDTACRPDQGCTCGLQQVLDGLETPDEGGPLPRGGR